MSRCAAEWVTGLHLFFTDSTPAADKIRIGYSGVTVSNAMLWVIDEGKLFQKNGIDPQILYLRLSNGQETATAAVFIAIGFEPETTLLRGLVEIDPMGHAPVDLHMQTSVPGLFASVPRDKGALDRSLLYPATA